MDKIIFTVNGEPHTVVGSEVTPQTTLNDYLRITLQLHGTKFMCNEGGCGACVVSVTQVNPVTKEQQMFSVNSCLVHILSCHQWNITTIEGAGNRKDGYHPLQTRLATFNGTQCGYCTPGWVMNMYSLYEGSNRRLNMQQVEKSFGGNMCRCTGYRSILDAFKSFAVDADSSLKNRVTDIEDILPALCKRKCSIMNEDWCVVDDATAPPINIQMNGSRWYKAFSVADVFEILAKEGVDSYRLVAGNTGQGVYWPAQSRIYIDISSIDVLKESLRDVNLVLGAGLGLTEVMRLFEKWANTSDDFKYLDEFYKHLDLVAHVPVRNIGTIGGNLAMKNQRPEFPSDVFLIFETVQATVTIINNALEKKELSMQDFLREDLRNKLILNVKLPPLASNYHVRSYKLMPRSQNAHAIINAGFLFQIDSTNKIESTNIVFGAINPSFVRARETENVLRGLNLFDNDTLQKAFARLDNELIPNDVPPEPSPFCRKTLASGLLYKAILSLCPTVGPRYKSGGTLVDRGVSRGTQVFDTDKSLWPLNQPMPKLEALTQCSGEVKFACDIPSSPRDVHVAFVLSSICVGEIDSFDATDALNTEGVLAFYTAKDIPGKNSFIPLNVPYQEFEEEIFASNKISFYGQPVGIVVAVTHKLAMSAAGMVRVTYKNTGATPVLSIKDALAAPDKDKRMREEVNVTATDKGNDVKHVIKGEFSMGSQYHYTMETQSCSVSVTDQGVRVRAATQWMDHVHVAISESLGLPENKIDVEVPRIGGGYGGKASRATQIACACALAAYKLNRNASLVMPLRNNMAAIGKRMACYSQYEVGVDDAGVIQYMDISTYTDCGSNYNDSAATEVAGSLTALYSSTRWNLKSYGVLTDLPSHTWCRAPGCTEGTAIIEDMMERIAFTTKRDPIDVRLANVAPSHNTIKDIVASFKQDCNYDERKAQIAKYNADNAWKKKALSFGLMAYPIGYGSGNYPLTVSVYHADGTVAICHGGIEMGQGINTKAAQVCAYTLKIPIEKVSVKGSNNFVAPNNVASAGSITSECIAYAAVKACQILLERLEEVKKDMSDPSWEEVVTAAYNRGINLQASYMTSTLDGLESYYVYGACATEVELDALTGGHVLRRVDLIEDTGVSLSPEVDVGQIEGAYIMGLGVWTSEQLIYDRGTGRLLTSNTWTYKPCGARDIPADFRISFVRNSVNRAGVLRSKATGEPALVLAVGVTHSLHEAILEVRKEFGYKDTDWVDVDTPYSTENILRAIAPKTESYKLQ